MIKGCSRQVIVLKNTGSDLFEEAYFIVKSGGCAAKHDDLLLEANRIIHSKAAPAKTAERNAPKFIQLILGFVLGILLAFPVTYFMLSAI